MFLLYEVLFHIALVLAFPVLVVRKRLRQGLSERTGYWPSIVYDRLRGRRIVWIHCASVGEVEAARPLVSALFARLEGRRFLVTTMTMTGLRQAEKAFGKQAVVALLPLDSKLFLSRVFAHVTPESVLIFETELWPQFIRMARAAGARLILVNGRISARSFPRYRLIRPFMARILAEFDSFLMCDEPSAERIRVLGADPAKVHALGNVKWAGASASQPPRRVAGWQDDVPVLVAGSTHEGEEERVLDAFDDLRQYYPTLRLVLAPRHPQRIAAVEALLRSRGAAFRKHSQGGDCRDATVYLIDTVGELAAFFAHATAVFLGGSLVDVGGHNVLEPAAAGVPVLYGPHMQNFAEVAAALEARGAGLRVPDWRGLAKELRDLLADEGRRRRMGAAGQALVKENRAVLDAYVAALEDLLDVRQAV